MHWLDKYAHMFMLTIARIAITLLRRSENNSNLGMRVWNATSEGTQIYYVTGTVLGIRGTK